MADPAGPLAAAAAALAAGAPREALKHVKAALGVDKACYDAYVLAGRAAEALGEAGQAAIAYTKASGLDGARPDAWAGLLELHAAAGEDTKGIEAARRLLSANPPAVLRWQTIRRLAEALSRSGQREAAAREWAALAADPPDASGHLAALAALHELLVTAPGGSAQAAAVMAAAGELTEKSIADQIVAASAPSGPYGRFHLLALQTALAQASHSADAWRHALACCERLTAAGCPSPRPVEAKLELLTADALVRVRAAGHEGSLGGTADADVAQAVVTEVFAQIDRAACHAAHRLPGAPTAALALARAGWHRAARVAPRGQPPPTARIRTAAALARALAAPSAHPGPGRADAWALLSELQTGLGRPVAALESAKQGLRICPAESTLLRLQLAAAEAQVASVSKFAEGEAALAAIVARPAIPPALRSRGALAQVRAAGTRGNWAVARALAEGALQWLPAEPLAVRSWAQAEAGWAAVQLGDAAAGHALLEAAVLAAGGPEAAPAELRLRRGCAAWACGGELRSHRSHAYADFIAAAATEGPAQAAAFARLGAWYEWVSGDQTRARRCYGRAIALDPSLGAAGAGLCRLLTASGEHDAAAAVCTTALQRASTAGTTQGPVWAARGLGFASAALGRNDAAVAAFQAALRSGRSDAACWEGLASAYHALGRFSAAQRAYEKALSLDAERRHCLCGLAALHLTLAQPHLAAACFERALALPGGAVADTVALAGSASALLAAARRAAAEGGLGRAAALLQKARARAEAALAVQSDVACLWKGLGDIELMHATVDPAATASQAAGAQSVSAAATSSEHSVLDDVMPWLSGGADSDSGATEAAPAPSTAGGPWDAAAALARWRGRVEALGAAARAYIRAAQLMPGAPSLLADAAIAMVYEAALRRAHPSLLPAQHGPQLLTEAVRLLQAALRLAPADATMWETLGSCGPLEQREYALARSLSLNSGAAPAWATLGDLYLTAGRAGRALTAYERARCADPTLAAAWAGTAALAAAAGPARSEDVLLHWEQAAVLGGGPEVRLEYALAALAAGQGGAAAPYAAARQAASGLPLNPVAWATLGLCALARGAPNEATTAIQTAVDVLALRPALAYGNSEDAGTGGVEGGVPVRLIAVSSDDELQATLSAGLARSLAHNPADSAAAEAAFARLEAIGALHLAGDAGPSRSLALAAAGDYEGATCHVGNGLTRGGAQLAALLRLAHTPALRMRAHAAVLAALAGGGLPPRGCLLVLAAAVETDEADLSARLAAATAGMTQAAACNGDCRVVAAAWAEQATLLRRRGQQAAVDRLLRRAVHAAPSDARVRAALAHSAIDHRPHSAGAARRVCAVWMAPTLMGDAGAPDAPRIAAATAALCDAQASLVVMDTRGRPRCEPVSRTLLRRIHANPTDLDARFLLAMACRCRADRLTATVARAALALEAKAGAAGLGPAGQARLLLTVAEATADARWAEGGLACADAHVPQLNAAAAVAKGRCLAAAGQSDAAATVWEAALQSEGPSVAASRIVAGLELVSLHASRGDAPSAAAALAQTEILLPAAPHLAALVAARRCQLLARFRDAEGSHAAAQAAARERTAGPAGSILLGLVGALRAAWASAAGGGGGLGPTLGEARRLLATAVDAGGGGAVLRSGDGVLARAWMALAAAAADTVGIVLGLLKGGTAREKAAAAVRRAQDAWSPAEPGSLGLLAAALGGEN